MNSYCKENTIRVFLIINEEKEKLEKEKKGKKGEGICN